MIRATLVPAKVAARKAPYDDFMDTYD